MHKMTAVLKNNIWCDRTNRRSR